MDNHNVFDLSLAISLTQNGEQFPVDFDNLWQWCGYSAKDKGKRSLLKNFEKGFDYQITQSGELRPQGGYSNLEIISLTLDAAKEFAMLAQTEQGKVVRKYFIEAEKVARKLAQDSQLRNMPPKRDTLEYLEACKKVEEISDPLLRSLIRQRLAEDLGHKNLAPAEGHEPRLVAVNVRARELGIPASLIESKQGWWSIGSVVARDPRFQPQGKIPLGSFMVNTYYQCDDLDRFICDYFDYPFPEIGISNL